MRRQSAESKLNLLDKEITRAQRARERALEEARRLGVVIDELGLLLDHASAMSSPESTGVSRELAQGKGSFDYLAFEHRFRGPVAEIKLRQTMYLELFRNRERVVDLGCGRGEFVELLSENGVGVVGVDSNEDMISFCRSRNLPVVQSDVFAYLAGLPEASLGGAASLQVVEHLPPERILELICLVGAKLAPCAPMVAETVNPSCSQAMANFYVDPTHVRPVPARLLAYLFEQGPFVVQTLRFSAPVLSDGTNAILDLDQQISADVSAYQDYAVVAIRR
jgi:SAM-dependent methyltransferase